MRLSVVFVLGVLACARTDSPAPAASPPAGIEDAPAAVVLAAEDAPERPRAPVMLPAAAAAHAAAQGAMHGGVLESSALVEHQAIEAPAHGPSPLQAFHEALRALERGADPDGKVRVAVYGSSSTSADRYTGYLRRYLQARFGDGGPGFVATVPLWRWHRHELVSVTATKHWAIEHAQKKQGRLDGRYGLLGASAYTTNKRARTRVEPKGRTAPVSSIELWLLEQPQGGRFSLRVGKSARVVQTKAKVAAPRYEKIALEEATSSGLEIAPRGDGEVRLFGAALETDGPGVVVDNLGIGGTRAANHLAWDEAMWREGIRRRAPELYVLAYGANEAIDVDEPIETYRDSLAAVLARFHEALPQSSCLLIGPQDYPMRDPEAGKDGPWLTRPRLGEVVEIQREVAAEAGCGFFDLRAMMGGDGGMERWVTADPPLGKADHLHLTPLGYLHLGRVLSDALMAEYDAGS